MLKGSHMTMSVSHSRALPRWLRPVLWGVIALSLGLIVLHILLYSPLLAMPDSWSFVIVPAVLLVVYAGIVLMLPTVARVTDGTDALRLGTRVGLLVAVIEALNISLESLVAMPQKVTAIVTGSLMLGTFTLWGVVGFLAAYRSRKIGLGVLAAVWCSMVTMLLAVTFGYALLVIAWPRLTTFLATDPDFLRSHWSDLRAFTIANTLSNGATHLLEAPVIASIVGGIGASLSRLFAGIRAATEKTQ
jgi:hypothetical protein